MAPITVDGQEASATRRAVVVVRAVGPDSAALPGVNVAISRSDVGAILVGRTDAAGTYTFVLHVEATGYVVLARRPGLSQAQSSLTFGLSDTTRVNLVLVPANPTELGGVRVEARPSNYVLSAEQISASRRPIRDAFEALQKLRPSMLYDRDRCKAEVVENVWVNGRRVLFMAKSVPILGARGGRAVAGVRISTPGGGSRSEPPAVDSVLASIRAEHVLEIRLADCWDTWLPGVGGKNALYVALKPGVDWNWKIGSFIADPTVYNRKR